MGKAGDYYIVRDLRTRVRKEPDELAANNNLLGISKAANVWNTSPLIYNGYKPTYNILASYDSFCLRREDLEGEKTLQ